MRDRPEPEGFTPATGRTTDAIFRALYQDHGPALLSYTLRYTNGDRHRAEDIVQETLVRAWRNVDTLTNDVKTVRAWLLTVARNIAIDQIRAQRSRPTEVRDEIIDQRPDPFDGVDELVNVDEVRAALAKLPDRLRETLIEVFVQERTIKEAAERLGVPPGTVKSRTFYGLKAMRKALERRGIEFRQPGPRG